jgi:hypothetical protein
MQMLLSLPPPGWRWLALLPVLCCLSCAAKDGLNPVQGKIFYKNEPMSGALVTFHPKGGDDITALRPTGLVKDDGTFQLATGPKEGAPAGEYVVTVIWSEIAPKAKKGFSTEMPETQDRLKGAYATKATSTLKVEVKKGVNQLEPFQLK